MLDKIQSHSCEYLATKLANGSSKPVTLIFNTNDDDMVMIQYK